MGKKRPVYIESDDSDYEITYVKKKSKNKIDGGDGGNAPVSTFPTQGPAPGFTESDPVQPSEAEIEVEEFTNDPITRQQDFSANVQDRVAFDIIKDDGIKEIPVMSNSNDQSVTITWNHTTFNARQDTFFHMSIQTPVNPQLANKQGLWRPGKYLRLISTCQVWTGTNNLQVGSGKLEHQQYVDDLVNLIHCGKLFPNESIYDQNRVIDELVKLGFFTEAINGKHYLQTEPMPQNMKMNTSNTYVKGEDHVVDYYMNPENIVTFDNNGQLKIDVNIPLYLLNPIFTNNIPENTPFKMTVTLNNDVTEAIIPWSKSMGIYENIKAVKIFHTMYDLDMSINDADMIPYIATQMENDGVIRVPFNVRQTVVQNTAAIGNAFAAISTQATVENVIYYWNKRRVIPQPVESTIPNDQEFWLYWQPTSVKFSFSAQECKLIVRYLILKSQIANKKQAMKLENTCTFQIPVWTTIRSNIPQGVKHFSNVGTNFTNRPTAVVISTQRIPGERTGYFPSQYWENIGNIDTPADYPTNLLELTDNAVDLKYITKNGIFGPMTNENDLSLIEGFRLNWQAASNNEWRVNSDREPYFRDFINTETCGKSLLHNRPSAAGNTERFIESNFYPICDPGVTFTNTAISKIADGYGQNGPVVTGNPLLFIGRNGKTKQRTVEDPNYNIHHHELRSKWLGMFMAGKDPNGPWSKIDINRQYICGMGSSAGKIMFSPNPRGGYNPYNTTDPSYQFSMIVDVDMDEEARHHMGWGQHIAAPYPARPSITTKIKVRPSTADGKHQVFAASDALTEANFGTIFDFYTAWDNQLSPLTLPIVAGAPPARNGNPVTLEQMGLSKRTTENQYPTVQLVVSGLTDVFIVLDASNSATYTSGSQLGF